MSNNNNKIKLEVSGGRYVTFTDRELHVSGELGVMETEPNITTKKDVGSNEVLTTAMKDKYSVIDLWENTVLSRNNRIIELESIYQKLLDYNHQMYNKKTHLLLIDSSEYRYVTERHKDSKFVLDASYIRAIQRYKVRGNYKSDTHIPNYPNIWKDNGRICEGRANITGGVDTLEHALKRMVHEFFITQFNTDLTSMTHGLNMDIPWVVRSFYFTRRCEQLGLDESEQDYLYGWERSKYDSFSNVYDAMVYYAIMGIDYANVYK